MTIDRTKLDSNEESEATLASPTKLAGTADRAIAAEFAARDASEALAGAALDDTLPADDTLAVDDTLALDDTLPLDGE